MAKLIPVNDRELPFRLSARTVGAQRAYMKMVSQYGVAEGRRIFLAKANERGTGSTITKRVDEVYKTGSKLSPVKSKPLRGF